MLVASGLVTQTQLDDALKRQRSDGGRLGEVLVNDGLVTEQDIVNAVAGQMRIGVIDLTQTRRRRAPSASCRVTSSSATVSFRSASRERRPHSGDDEPSRT